MTRNGTSGNVAKYCADHWTPLTVRSYDYKLRFWKEFTAEKGLDPFDISQERILQMLIFMFEVKKKHVRTIRATFTVGRILCRAAGCPFSVQGDRQVRMLLQGMFKKRPDPIISKPCRIWDISQLLDYFCQILPNSKLTLRALGCKLACLLMMVSMRRCIDLTRLDIAFLNWLSPREARFQLTGPSKTFNYRTRKEHAELLQSFTVTALPITREVDKKLCPVRCLRHY